MPHHLWVLLCRPGSNSCCHRALSTQSLYTPSGSFVESLRSTGQFPSKAASQGAGGGDDAGEGEKESKETLSWALFLRAQLEERTGMLQQALDSLEVRHFRGMWGTCGPCTVVHESR